MSQRVITRKKQEAEADVGRSKGGVSLAASQKKARGSQAATLAACRVPGSQHCLTVGEGEREEVEGRQGRSGHFQYVEAELQVYHVLRLILRS